MHHREAARGQGMLGRVRRCMLGRVGIAAESDGAVRKVETKKKKKKGGLLVAAIAEILPVKSAGGCHADYWTC